MYEAAKGIAKRICKDCDVDFPDVIGPVRSKKLVEARKKIASVLRGKGFSYPEIGAVINRDHSSVMFYKKRNPGLWR